MLVGLASFIWNYARPAFFGLLAVTSLLVNGMSKVVYSMAKSGLSFDFLSMFVRTRVLPFNPHRFPVTTVSLNANDAERFWWRRLLDRMVFATHRKIIAEPMLLTR